MTMYCCYEGCCDDAEFRIKTHRKDGSVVGPDAYGDSTDACEAHVGALLGWQPKANDTDDIVWTVYRITLDHV